MTSTHGESGPAEPSADQRLDSWKEIATYLKRDERTVRRWEAQQGLPVHRHLHTKGASVYAFRSEIDVWWNNGRERLDTANETATLRPRLLRWPVAIAAGALLTATIGTGLWFLARPSLDFEARDWVLIADFENETGGAIADGTVEYALAHALSESRFVNVVPRERVVDTLGLMRRPPETAVDAAVGREIALRDGGIRVVLTGRVDKLDTTYAVSAVLVEPATGRTVASVREEAAGDSEFLPAVQRLSNLVRARLGEALADIERSARALEKVTTPSLSALQLFSEADALIALNQGKSNVAEGLLRQAVAEDPDFASGYMHLAHTIRNQGRPATEYLPPAERAVELGARVSERERYFILGSYHQMLGEAARAALDQDLAPIEYEQAVTVNEALLRLYPDHYWGTNNLVFINQRLGRQEEAWRWRARRADLRPTHLQETLFLVRHFLGSGDVAAAEPYIERARALASAEGADPRLLVQASFLKVDAAWVGGDAEQALAALNEVVASGPPQTREARDSWRFQASLRYQALGMLDAAHDMAVEIDADSRYMRLAFVAWARDDRQAARDHLRRCPPSPFNLFWLARAGAPDEVREALEAGKTGARAGQLKSVRGELARLGELKTVRGELARLEGRLGETIPLLEEGLAEIRGSSSLFYLGSDSLALAWLAQGEPSRAARVLDEAAQAVPPNLAAGSFWLTVELRRAQVYRQLGRVEEAEQIEARLRKLLAHADPDHVILRELKRLSS